MRGTIYRIHYVEGSEGMGTRIKCRFCDWETRAWTTRRVDGGKRYGGGKLEEHVYHNHPEEYRRLKRAGIVHLEIPGEGKTGT